MSAAQRSIAFMAAALLLAAPVQSRQSVTVAAAADLVYCLEVLSGEFTKRHTEIDLIVSTGSSGTFFRQIVNGAPFDVYLSADMSYPKKLVDERVAERGSLTPYAIGRIVLWTTRSDLRLDPEMKVLLQPSVRRIAIANPEHAPYGRAAKAALEQAHLWRKVESKIVYGQNISHAMQFVNSGNADIGIIALSLVKGPRLRGKGRYLLVPEDMHPRLEQGMVLTSIGSRNSAAKVYFEFLRSPQAREIFERYGFALPSGAR
jgi:molybdate transport system substrate-binding protein